MRDVNDALRVAEARHEAALADLVAAEAAGTLHLEGGFLEVAVETTRREAEAAREAVARG